LIGLEADCRRDAEPRTIMIRTPGTTTRRDGTKLACLLDRPRGPVVEVRARKGMP